MLKVGYPWKNIGNIFHCPKNVLCSILSFVFWILPPLDTAAQLESADSKQNAISKSLFQDSYPDPHIFWAMRNMHYTFWKKRPLVNSIWAWFNSNIFYLFKDWVINWLIAPICFLLILGFQAQYSVPKILISSWVFIVRIFA